MLPERFGRYEVIDEIGDGAMGRVYRAWDPAVNRLVAVKTIKTEYLTRDTADEYLRRFHREAQSAGGLNHPAIVRVFDLGNDYLVMELVEGRTLHRVIRDEGRLAPPETLRLLAPVADAVDHAHRAGIVHRDIKPANIMVQPDGQPKLMDFGVAKIEASVMTTAGQVLGSPSYMSPEQIAGLDVTGRSDLYSLAVVAYEMLTGQPPFQGRTITQVIYKVMHEAPPPPRQWNAALPARYDGVFARALSKDPAARFPTAGELVAALDIQELEYALSEAAESRPSTTVGATPGDDVPTMLASAPPRPAAEATKDHRRLALGAAGLLAALLVAWLGLRRAPADPVEAPGPSPAPASPVAARATPAPVAATPAPSAPSPREERPARHHPRAGRARVHRPADSRARRRGPARRDGARRHAARARRRGIRRLPPARAQAEAGRQRPRRPDRGRERLADRRAGGGVRGPDPRRGRADGRAHVALRAGAQGRGPGQGTLAGAADLQDRTLTLRPV